MEYWFVISIVIISFVFGFTVGYAFCALTK
jgi:hypothetical protein